MPESGARTGKIRIASVVLRAVLIAAPLVAVLAGVFLYATRTQTRLLNQSLAGEAERDLAIQRRVLLGYFEQGMRDVLVLSGAERMLDLLDEDTPRNRRRVGELFLSVLQRKGYDQLRYIDADGMEWARANLNLNQPSIVPPGELQYKKDRYYVSETLALDRDGIYVSPLDLNYERGFMEVPLKPTLRICTPVFDRRGAKRGVLVINYLAREALNTLGQEDAPSGHQTVLLAKDGYFLRSVDPNDEWGFILPARKQRNYVQLHPEVWEAMTRADKGVVHNAEGLFVFEAVRLEDQSEQWPGGPKFRVVHGSRVPGANRWILVSFTPQAVLAARTAELHEGTLAMSGLSALALLLVSGVLALSLERRRAVAAGLAQAEAAARMLSTDLQGVLDASTEISIIATDTAGLITTFNSGAERLLGYRAEEMVGKMTPAVFHLESEVVRRGEELSRLLERPVQGFEAFVALAREGLGDTREWTYVRKGGEHITVRLTVTARRDAGGEVVGFLGLAVDVTEQVRVAESQRAGEERLRLFIRHTPAAVAMFDRDMRYIVASRRWKEDYGLGDQDLTGRSHYEVFPEIGQEWKDVHQRVLAGEIMRRDEDPFPRADGSVDYVRWENVPWRRDDGSIGGIVMFTEVVTERVRTAEALRAGEERLRLFIRHTPAAVAMFDTDMRYIVASRRWKEDYGLGDQDLTGRSHYEVFPEIGQEWKDVHQRVLAGEIMRRDEDPFPRADGSVDYVRWENVPWRRDDGSIGGIVMFTEVVTERVKAREALQESQRRFQDLADLAPVGIFETDANGDCRFVNENWRKLSGLTQEQAMGQGWAGAIHPEDREMVAREWYSAAEERREFRLEYRFRRPDGRVSWVIGAASAKRDEAGKVTGYFGSVLDITERRQAEEAVRLSQARLDAVVNTAVDGIITINTAGIIQTVNPAAARIFGYAPEEMVGNPVTMLQIEPYRSEHDGYLARYLATGDPHIIGRGGREVPGRRKDGVVFPLELSVSEVRVGEQWFFTGMLKDISERKRLEVELLTAKEQAEAASQAKSEFLARMSHEIRTPMNAVLGLTHLALKTRLDAQQQEYLTKVQTSARLLLGIINDILDFSKIEAGRLDLETADFDLDEVLDGLTVVVGQAAQGKGLALSVAADPDVPRQLAGDALRLTQVLVNLLNNAVKFTEEGEVTLRVSRGDEAGHGIPLRFVIRDTGMGMDEAAQSRLFQSFSQADESITRRFGGTGLGLAISKRLVELMGGDITVASTPGAGSTFTVRLALAPASDRPREAGGAAPSPEAMAGIRGAEVLVAEDNAINRQVARELLAAAGLRVFEAENGLAAVQAVEKRDFDLVFMDVHMPVMDGLEATRRMRQSPRGKKLPIVAMTASVMTGDRHRSLDAGMDDHLAKPFTPGALARMLVKWIKPGDRSPLPDAAPAAPPLAAPLPAASGLDTARGMASAGNKPDLYRSLLNQFAREFGNATDRLEAAFAAADADNATFLAHSLRGVAGNLGATEVAQAAADMEQALRAGDTARARSGLAGLATALRHVLDSIRLLDAGAGNGEEEPASPHADTAALGPGLDRLEELLARQDLDADAAAGELARLLAGTRWARLAQELADAVAGFDYAQARQHIAALRTALEDGKREA